MNSLAEKPILQKLADFLYTPAYVALIGVLTVISNIFSAELPVYTCIVLIGLFICFRGRDFLPFIPIVVGCYIAPSTANNPGRNENSIFSPGHGGIYLLTIAVILIGCIVWRLIKDPKIGGKHFLHTKRCLTSGFLILGGAYMLAGLGSPYFFSYGIRNAFFGLMQFVSLFAIYYLLCGSVQWDKAPKDYLAWVGVTMGFVLLFELLGIYLTNNVIRDGEIYRKAIIAGWGHYNNIGSLMVIMLPFPFALARKSRRSSLFYLCGTLFFVGVIFTCSRTSILFGLPVYLASYIAAVVTSRQSRMDKATHILTIAAVAAVALLLHDQVLKLFQILVERGFKPADRDLVYKAGWEQFLHDPIFGGTFFPVAWPDIIWSTSEAFVSVFPVRWHNTIIQLLASCGIVGLAAYAFHRYQTVRLFLKNCSPDKIFVGISILALLLTSLLDCHFFNLGPALFYSASLAFMEKRLTPASAESQSEKAAATE